MRRLSGLDGAFLAFESPTTHLHIAGVLIFDPIGVPGGVGFHQIREVVADRVRFVPPFRSRMVEVPFGLQHPSIVDDPDFDIDFHVRRASLPRPGGPSELAALVGSLVERPLDRQRPLWEFHIVEGLEHGHVALVSKVHHSIIDGVSGAEVMAAFFDLSPDSTGHSPDGRQTGPRASKSTDGESSQDRAGSDPAPPPVPGEVDRLRDALGSLPVHTEKVARTIGRTLQAARNLNGRNRQVTGVLPPSPFDAPRTSINRAISPHRRVAFADIPLSDVQRVRTVLGGTVNDIVLTVVAGAMRSFFDHRGEEIESSLVAMVPISVRSESDRKALGNQVSAMLVSLASGVEDPAARLRLITEGTRSAKEQQRVVGSEVFAGWAQALFPAVATRASRLVTNLRLFDHLPPMFNVILSNIPGPDFPLYVAGARMVAMYPLGPIIEGVGVNVTVFSYFGTMYVGVQACWDLVPDVEVIAHGVRESLDALVKEADRRDRPVPWWHVEPPDESG